MSTPKDHGGPAFPSVATVETDSQIWDNTSFSNVHSVGGMTLRDWFAGMALHASFGSGESFNDVAERAYLYADAMIAERNKGK
jgi:hypothetical protein